MLSINMPLNKISSVLGEAAVLEKFVELPIKNYNTFCNYFQKNHTLDDKYFRYS